MDRFRACTTAAAAAFAILWMMQCSDVEDKTLSPPVLGEYEGPALPTGWSLTRLDSLDSVRGQITGVRGEKIEVDIAMPSSRPLPIQDHRYHWVAELREDGSAWCEMRSDDRNSVEVVLLDLPEGCHARFRFQPSDQSELNFLCAYVLAEGLHLARGLIELSR